eukprot:Skav211539  [mRNA]  locus=scaffold352:478609:478947:- [translate_table: standard]
MEVTRSSLPARRNRMDSFNVSCRVPLVLVIFGIAAPLHLWLFLFDTLVFLSNESHAKLHQLTSCDPNGGPVVVPICHLSIIWAPRPVTTDSAARVAAAKLRTSKGWAKSMEA